MSFRVTLCTVLLASVNAGVRQGAAAEPAAVEARAALEQWFAATAKVRTVQAEFEQLRQLKSVRRPLRKQGRLWMDKDDGLFRWQIGEPPEVLAVRGRDGSMTVLDEKQKQVRVWSRQVIEGEEQQGRGQGFAMFNSMQNTTSADFDKGFDLDGWRQDAANPAAWSFDWKFKDAKIALFVLKLTLNVNIADGSMQSFTIHMRDGSSMGTVIRSQTLNQPVAADTFKVDTTGYSVEQMTSRS